MKLNLKFPDEQLQLGSDGCSTSENSHLNSGTMVKIQYWSLAAISFDELRENSRERKPHIKLRPTFVTAWPGRAWLVAWDVCNSKNFQNFSVKSYSIARDKNWTFSMLELMERTRMTNFSLISTSLPFLLSQKLWRDLSWTKNGNRRGSFSFLFVWGGENKFGNCWWCQHALTCSDFCSKTTQNPRGPTAALL